MTIRFVLFDSSLYLAYIITLPRITYWRSNCTHTFTILHSQCFSFIHNICFYSSEESSIPLISTSSSSCLSFIIKGYYIHYLPYWTIVSVYVYFRRRSYI